MNQQDDFFGALAVIVRYFDELPTPSFHEEADDSYRCASCIRRVGTGHEPGCSYIAVLLAVEAVRDEVVK